HRRAADWIAARDRREMDRHWRRVRTLLADVPETQDALALGVLACRNIIYSGYVFGRAGDEATALFTQGIDLATRLDAPGPRVGLLNAYANARLSAGAIDEALANMRESLRLAEQTRNDFLRFIARVPLSTTLAMSGRLREGLALSEEAGALGREAPALETEPGASPYLMLLDMRTQMLAYLGRLQEADQTIERVMDVARARKDGYALRMAYVRAVNICELTGDGPRALAYARRAMELVTDAGEGWGRVRAFGALGLACLLNGQWHEAIEVMSTAVGI